MRAMVLAMGMGLMLAGAPAAARDGVASSAGKRSTGPSRQDLIDRQQANRIYEQQLERDRQRKAVQDTNAAEQAQYRSDYDRYRADLARYNAEMADRRRRCAAGQSQYC